MARILLISAQKPDNTGSGVFLKALARSFTAGGHAVAVIAGVAREDDFAFPAGILWHPVRFETDELPYPVVGMSDEMPYKATRYRDLTPGMLESFYAAFDRALDEVLPALAPDVVFSNHLYVLTAHLVRRGLAAPIVGMCHGSEIRQIRKNPLERDAIRAGVRALAGVMALHEAQKSQIVEEYGITGELVHVTGTGYDAGVFNLDGGIARKPRSLVFAGKIAAAKGVPSLLRAADALERPEEVRLVLAGGYATQEEYDAIVAQARACRCEVEFAGRLPQARLADAYRGADVFVLPSFYEGLPLVVVEALACGCKVVVTDLPGIRPWLGANAPEAPVWYVAPPAMHDVDEPEPWALPAFERRLADAIRTALDAPAVPCDVSALSWDALAARCLALAALR